MRLLLIAFLLPGTQEDERRLLKETRAALRTGNYDQAQRLARRLKLLSPASWEPRRLWVRAAVETGKLDEAVAECREYLQALPLHPRARATLADILVEKDDPASALETLGAPTDVAGRYQRARALVALGRDDEALKVVEGFVEEHNRRREEFMKEDLFALARGLLLYANLAAESEIYKQVVRSISADLLKADPQDPVVKTFLADAYLEKHNKDAALRLYREALSVNPRHVPALVGLAEHAIASRKPAEAEPFLEQALAVDGASSRAHYLRAVASLGIGALEHARQAAKRGLEARPKSPFLHSILAAVHHQEQNTRERDEEIQEVLKGNPKSPLPYLEIARALLASGWQYLSANLWFRKATEQNPRYRPALVEYGMNCLRVADEETGAKILREANKRDPFDIRVQNLVNLLDDFDTKFSLLTPTHYRVRIRKDEQAWMEPYVLELLDRAWTAMSKRYGFSPKEAVLVEVFGNHSDFSVRTTGLPDMPALGACFGPVVTTLSPRAQGQVGNFNWGAVLWHEMAHVFALQLSEYHCPSWFTEGLSTYEESLGFGGWEREIELEMMLARHRGELGGVKGLESGGGRKNRILLLYHQGSWILEYIDKTWGFAKIADLLRSYAKRKATFQAFQEVLGVGVEEFDKGFFAWMDARMARNLYRLPQKDPLPKLQADYAVSKTPENAIRLCAGHLDQDDFDGAVRIGREAAGSAPDDWRARALYGQALYRKRRVDEAIPELEAATLKNPCDWQTWTALGSAYLDEDRPKDAVRALEKARDCFPKFIAGENAYRKLNEAHLALKDYGAALRDIEAMLAVDHLDFRNRLKVAGVRAERKEWDRVRLLTGEAVWIETRDRALHRLIAQTATELGEFDRALRQYGIVLALIDAGETGDEAQDRADTFCDLGDVHLKLGEREKARGYAQDALRLLPGHERARKLYERATP